MERFSSMSLTDKPHFSSDAKKKAYISRYIISLIKKHQRPRNQIAAVSGLTNTYIKDLEEGNIINVRREKLLALSVALELTLKDVDDLLSVFDRRPLDDTDIPLLVNYSRKSKISTAMTPLYSALANGQLLSIENSLGPYTIVNPEPTYILMADNHPKFEKQNSLLHHPLDELFGGQALKERRRLFLKNIARYPVNQYICIDCLQQYARRYNDPLEKKLRQNHLHNVIAALCDHENFHLHLLDICPSISFSLKQTEQSIKNPDLLIILFWPQHRLKWLRSGKLRGFITRHQALVQHYKDELASLKETVIADFTDRNKLISYLKELAKN